MFEPVTDLVAGPLPRLTSRGQVTVAEAATDGNSAELLAAERAAARTAAPAPAVTAVTELVEAASRQVFAPDPLADPVAAVAGPTAASAAAAARIGLEVRLVDTHADVAAAVKVLDAVFAPGTGQHFYPPSLLRNLLAAGAPVLLAWDGRASIGVVLALPGWDAAGRPLLHSGPMAVLPAARGRGVLVALKLGQRRWALERGVPEIRWTFDVMVAVNARLNLCRLGAVAEAFLPGYEGVRDGHRGTALPHDRLLVTWRLAGTVGPGPGGWGEAGWAVASGPAGLPDLDPGWELLPAARVALPADITRLRREAPAAASAWQHAVGQVLQTALAGGWRVGWHGGGYLLTPPADRPPTADGVLREPSAAWMGTVGVAPLDGPRSRHRAAGP